MSAFLSKGHYAYFIIRVHPNARQRHLSLYAPSCALGRTSTVLAICNRELTRSPYGAKVNSILVGAGRNRG
jgi:hypothetical protein